MACLVTISILAAGDMRGVLSSVKSVLCECQVRGEEGSGRADSATSNNLLCPVMDTCTTHLLYNTAILAPFMLSKVRTDDLTNGSFMTTEDYNLTLRGSS